MSVINEEHVAPSTQRKDMQFFCAFCTMQIHNCDQCLWIVQSMYLWNSRVNHNIDNIDGEHFPVAWLGSVNRPAHNRISTRQSFSEANKRSLMEIQLIVVFLPPWLKGAEKIVRYLGWGTEDNEGHLLWELGPFSEGCQDLNSWLLKSFARPIELLATEITSLLIPVDFVTYIWSNLSLHMSWFICSLSLIEFHQDV